MGPITVSIYQLMLLSFAWGVLGFTAGGMLVARRAYIEGKKSVVKEAVHEHMDAAMSSFLDAMRGAGRDNATIVVIGKEEGEAKERVTP